MSDLFVRFTDAEARSAFEEQLRGKSTLMDKAYVARRMPILIFEGLAADEGKLLRELASDIGVEVYSDVQFSAIESALREAEQERY